MIIPSIKIGAQNEILPNISEQIKEVIRVIKLSPIQVGVEVFSGMYRWDPTVDAPAGYVGCDLLLHYNLNQENRGMVRMFLRHSTCDGILFFGEDFVRELIWGMVCDIINNDLYRDKVVII